MTIDTPAKISRRGLLFGAFALTAASPFAGALAAPSIIRGAGDVRLISLTNPRTGESLHSVYWVEGSYIPEVLGQVDHILRDWRLDLTRKIAPEVIDIIAGTHRLLETREPFTVFSGYRSPQTNRLLRSRSRSVARDSYHMKGMAADLHLKDRSVRHVAAAAATLNAGGVGRYSRSEFVHIDSGPVREWGR